ncbi:cadherin-like beta sandwich domain-containing protein [Cohnella thailandensis]|uniref:Cadherin-like beta sandwich domain-containing protein n=1 Tax=Cohnella thailandensis TaxID=557557 RepID=A0A841SYK7_9BACL|nr:cadherin-like beta sandwich domain-containing protein [Cohnella thailandensis]MBB6635989.1 cadherin-like beta sandwich domain-containing protein [Cohnella thailandensis]MBP1976367.1 hypothetical protein [Cohnella thailandensis]
MRSSIKRLFSRQRIAAALAFTLALQLVLSGYSSIIGGAGIASAVSETKYITFLYQDFAKASSRLQFNGNADYLDSGANQGDLRLTPSAGNQFGTVFNKERVSLRAGTGFSTYFTFNMSSPDGSGTTPKGADGIVFALQTRSNSAGSLGVGMGFENIKDSVGIEFDTFDNGSATWGSNGDPSNNHVAVDYDGVVTHGKNGNPAAVNVPGVDFNSGQDVHVWIDYKSTEQKLEVFLSSSSNRPSSPILTETGLNLAERLKQDDIYVGFTAATGAAWQNHDIKQWYFTNRYDPIDLSSATYVEAPSIFSVATSVYGKSSVTGATYYQSDVTLVNSSNEPGPGVSLIAENLDNTAFLDPANEMAPLASPPALVTDAQGKATYYYTAVDETQAIPNFRISTEYGAYYDLRFTAPPTVATGAANPQYVPNAPANQGASIPVQIVNTGGENVKWGVEYREKTADGNGEWSPTVYGSVPQPVLTASGTYYVQLNGLKEDTYYEARAYASNSKGAVRGEPVTFAVQMPMPADGVKYTNAGPSKIYRDDAESMQVVGENLYWLLKRLPHEDLSVKLTSGSEEYAIPRSDIQAVSNSTLKLKLPTPGGAKLPLGKYNLVIEHEFFGDKTFLSAIELTDDPSYRSINYEEVVVTDTLNHRPDPNDLDSIAVRGPFVVQASSPGIYQQRDSNAVFTFNDNLLFKGSQLTVDTNAGKITGSGRFYVNGKNTIPMLATYTVYEGEFEFTTDNFVFNLKGGLAGAASDLTGLNVPVNVNKLVFIPGGIRLAGEINLGFKMGSATIGGKANLDALEFKKNRFDLDADFELNADFKSGPLEAGALRFSLDTRVPEYGAGASAELKKAKIGFDIDLLIVDKKLDSLSFAVVKEMKLGSTGAQLTKIGGGVSNMTSKSEAPLTFSVLGGMSDYITPKLANTYMVNGNDLKIELSANHFGASGKLAIYKINIAGVDMFVVFNPTGYKGYNKAGFDFNASINIIDVIVGKVMANYFQGSSFTGYAKTAVQIPGSVPLVGGKKLTSAEVGVDSTRFKGALSVIGIGFTVKYPFSTSKFDWDVDMSSTIKNVANAVVNVGKSVVKAFTSWIWYDDPSKAGEWTAADSVEAVPGLVGEKLFSASGIRATEVGTYSSGKLATVVTETNPNMTKSGSEISQSFVAEESYPALIKVQGDASGVRLTQPNGALYEIRFAEKDNKTINAYYDAANDETILEVNLTPGTWKLTSGSSLALSVSRELYRNPSLTLEAAATELAASDVQAYVPLEFQKRGTYLVEVGEGAADAKLIKADGRPYATEADSVSDAYNTYWDSADGKLYMLVEVPDAGVWYAIAGADAHANLYRMAVGTTMGDALAWIGGDEFSSAAKFTGLKGMQVLLEIQGATEATRLYRPDGTLYPFDLNQASSNWNASYDAAQGVIHALVDVDQDGIWLIKSNGFTDSNGLTLSQKLTMAELYGSDTTITYDLQIQEKGKYLFDIAGGDATAKINVNNAAATINSTEGSPSQNAIIDDKGLMVTLDVPASGIVSITTKPGASIKQYLLTPIPEVTKLSASAQLQRNTYEVEWKVENAKPDTKVSLLLANGDRDEEGQLIPVGDTIASDLPAAGIRTVTLPEGYLPGDYYLAVVADSESYGPVFKTLNDPLTYQAVKMQPKPTGVQATAIGNGEIKIGFNDPGYAETTSYRIYPADAAGNVDFNGTSYEGEVVPANGANQSVTLSGLETGRDYSFRVMAIRAVYGSIPGVNDDALANLYVSELSDAASVSLPVPNPAKLNVTYLTGDAPTVTRSYYPYNVTEEKLAGLTAEEKQSLQQTMAITASDDVTVKVESDQNVTLKLFVDGVEAQAADGAPNEFHLGSLAEKDYTIEVEAVNAEGDISSSVGRLFADRTAPYLYLKSATNGQVVEDDRILLEGVSEAGVALTVNGVTVPVDAMGHYAYYASIPEAGVLPIEMIAVDQAGNETVHRLEVFSSGDGEGQSSSELVTLGTDDGVFTSAFKPDVANYELALDVRTKQLRVTAVPADPSAAVTIAGQAADEHYSAEINVTQGTEIPISVTSDGSAPKKYSIAVKSESDLASLSGLQLTGVQTDAAEVPIELSRSFGSTIESYEAEVESNVASVKVKPTASVSGSLIRVNGTPVASGQLSGTIALDAGKKPEITVEVLSLSEASASSPDWSKAKKYEISIARKASGDATLSQLQLAGTTMTPAEFNAEVSEYTARVGANTTSVTLNYAASDAGAVVTLNGEALSASGSTDRTLIEGNNRFILEVEAQDGTSREYTIVVYRDKPLSEALLLSELSVEGYELTSEFNPLVRNYNAKDSTLGSSVKVTAKAADADSVVKVNGQELNGEGTAIASLNVGDNSVLVQVESPDKSETNTYSIGITRGYVGGGAPTDKFEVKVNSNSNDKIATGKKTEENGQSLLKVSFLSDETKKLLESETANPVITINAGFSPDRMTTELTADLVQLMQQKNAVILIEAGDSYYLLPTAAMNLAQLSSTFAPKTLEEVTVRLDIRLLGADEQQSIGKQADKSGATLVGQAIDFNVNYTYEGRTISADRFSQYIERGIALPEGTDGSKVTTGVRVLEDGTLYHVPTYVKQVGDRYFAVMNSFTNSVYAVIYNKATFSDIAGKWSQAAIENLASRKIVTGQSDGTFAPTRSVTRAEFAAMIVRALGLPAQADSSFGDVKAKDWYAPFVATAKTYGLINGYTDGTFRPAQTITRAEAVAILNKAWVLAGKTAIGETESALTLERIADQSEIPAWARASIGSAVQLGLLTGYVDGTVKPLRTVSREETAAMLQNLLIRSDLIQSK